MKKKYKRHLAYSFLVLIVSTVIGMFLFQGKESYWMLFVSVCLSSFSVAYQSYFSWKGAKLENKQQYILFVFIRIIEWSVLVFASIPLVVIEALLVLLVRSDKQNVSYQHIEMDEEVVKQFEKSNQNRAKVYCLHWALIAIYVSYVVSLFVLQFTYSLSPVTNVIQMLMILPMGLVYIIYKSNALAQDRKNFRYILEEKCDATLYSKIYKVLANQKYVDIEVLSEQLVALYWSGENTSVEEAVFFEKFRFNKKLAPYQRAYVLLAPYVMSISDGVYDSLRTKYLSAFSNENTLNVLMLDLDLAVKKKEYERALGFIEKNEFVYGTNLAYQVKVEYQQAYCLYQLMKDQQAISLLEDVIAKGNTVVYVAMAKALLQQISARINKV